MEKNNIALPIISPKLLGSRANVLFIFIIQILVTNISTAQSPYSDVVMWNNGKAYFFHGNQYSRFDVNNDCFDEGYPASISSTWNGVWADGIDAATEWNNGYAYLFKGNKYIKYDMAADRTVVGYPKLISGNWPGLFESGIDAAVNWGNGYAYFFKGNQYIKYDMTADKSVPGYPKLIKAEWSGLFESGIDAAVNWGNGYAYFFKGSQYVKYDMAADKTIEGYPKNIADYWVSKKKKSMKSSSLNTTNIREKIITNIPKKVVVTPDPEFGEWIAGDKVESFYVRARVWGRGAAKKAIDLEFKSGNINFGSLQVTSKVCSNSRDDVNGWQKVYLKASGKITSITINSTESCSVGWWWWYKDFTCSRNTY